MTVKRLPAEYFLQRIEVCHTVQGVGFKATPFGPLVPAIDRQRTRPVGIGQQSLFGHFEHFFEVFGRIVHHDIYNILIYFAKTFI